MSASRHTATSKESTQVLSQVLPTSVDAVVVTGSVVLVVDAVAPDVVIVATGKADVIVVVVAVMLVATADVLDLAAVKAELLLTMAVLGMTVVVPVPASPPMQPEEAALHAENDAMSGPTNQSSPN